MRVIKTEPKHLKTPEEKRKTKGLVLFQKGYVAVMDNKATKFKVLSETLPVENGVKSAYDVKLGLYGENDTYICSCPDYAYNTDTCKHIYAAIYARHEAGYPLLIK